MVACYPPDVVIAEVVAVASFVVVAVASVVVVVVAVAFVVAFCVVFVQLYSMETVASVVVVLVVSAFAGMAVVAVSESGVMGCQSVTAHYYLDFVVPYFQILVALGYLH